MKHLSKSTAVTTVVLSGFFAASGLGKLILWPIADENSYSIVGHITNVPLAMYSIGVSELIVACVLLIHDRRIRRLAGAAGAIAVVGCSALVNVQSEWQTMQLWVCCNPFTSLTYGVPLGYLSVLMLSACVFVALSNVKSAVFLQSLHSALRVGIYVAIALNVYLIGIVFLRLAT